MDRLANMQAFRAVANSKSFAEAAKKLNIANSVISKRIKDLENYLGTQLFIRTTRKITLTETGASYLEYVSKILDDIDEVESSIQHSRDRPTGKIKLAAPLMFGKKHLGPILTTYLDKYPEVSIQSYLSDREIDLIDEGFDLAIRSGPLKDSTLFAKKLFSFKRVICASPTYFKREGKPLTPADLKRHNCLSYLNVSEGKLWPYYQRKTKKWQPVEGQFFSDSGDLLHEAVLAHAGITQLPTFVIQESLNSGALEAVLTEYSEPEIDFFVVYPHTRHLSIKIRTLIDHLSDSFTKK